MELSLNRKFTILCLLFAVFFLLNSPFFWKTIYPVYYQDEVNQAAEKHNVDPYLMYAIIQVESNFTDKRVSHKGARGIMQIMPDTALWVIEQAKFPHHMLTRLEEPLYNIHIGAWYISFLERKFHQNHYAVIAAYNAGPGNVEKWMKENKWDGTYGDLASIPYGETRHYIQRVLYFYGKYKEIYNKAS